MNERVKKGVLRTWHMSWDLNDESQVEESTGARGGSNTLACSRNGRQDRPKSPKDGRSGK